MEEAKNHFNRIYEEHVEKVYRFVYLKMGSREEAEDLASDVFSRIWDICLEGKHKEIENMRAFVYRIARNVISDYYRRGKKVLPLDDQQEKAWEGVAMEKTADTNIEMDRVQLALRELSDEQQDLVIWKYLEELSSAEIAELTGKTQENVRVSLHRAMNALKEKMSVPGK